MNLSEQVREQFRRLPEGKVISSRTLHKLSPDGQQVDKAASRLYKTAGLRKLRNGLFYRPRVSKYFGMLPPDEKELIPSLKQQYKACIGPSGELAAYELALIPDLPDAITYESDKRIASIAFDDRVINFRKVDQKKLASTNGRLFALFKALEFLYREQGELTLLQDRRVFRLLADFSEEQINKALINWPRWLQDKVKALKSPVQNRYITGLSAFNIPWQGKLVDWHQLGMLEKNRFHVAGVNYESAPGLNDEELFDCRTFLKEHGVKPGTRLCAKPLRAIKDILFNNIIKREQYPGFLMLDQFMLDIPPKDIVEAVAELKKIASEQQQNLLNQWLIENELN